MGHLSAVTGRQEIESAVLAAAERSPTFRELLRDDPRAALAEVLGSELPEDLEVRVVIEDPQLLYIVIPTHLLGHDRDVFHSLMGRPIPRE